MSRLATYSLILVLAGCGFQLQGAFTPPPQMERTYIEAVNRHSPLYRELRIAMQEAGIQLVDDPAVATATLNLSYDETDQRVLSVSARNVPTEYEVFYTIEYSLYAGQQTLLEMQSLTLTRDYTYDPTLVLGKAREEELLRAAIVDDLVRTILKQISTL